jgi:glycosyltransferase involved in cell wall biosynthesis
MKLVIVGKPGWMMDDFLQRVETHREKNSRLFLFTKVSDEELSALYRDASALLLLSKGEGFGLPLLEAAEADIPIICSDLPIFHEIAGSHATYVSIDDAAALKNQIQAWLNGGPTTTQSSAIQRLSWRESAEMLVALIAERQWQYRFSS